METVALRQFDPMYIIFDCLFLGLLIGLLVWKKKYTALIVGGLAGLLYMVVDYGIFNLLFGTRSINDGYSLFWVLLWMSISYGFTNFVWIWLWISKDKNLLEWSSLILMWWFTCPLLTKTFGGFWEPIVIQRTTGAYHGYMAILLFVGYLFIFIWNMAHREKKDKMPLLWLLAIGILVQLGWEAGLLLGGVRSAGLSVEMTVRTLITDSLLETNLGMPYIYIIYLFYSSKFKENCKKREDPTDFMGALHENNLKRVREQDVKEEE